MGDRRADPSNHTCADIRKHYAQNFKDKILKRPVIDFSTQGIKPQDVTWDEDWCECPLSDAVVWPARWGPFDDPDVEVAVYRFLREHFGKYLDYLHNLEAANRPAPMELPQLMALTELLSACGELEENMEKALKKLKPKVGGSPSLSQAGSWLVPADFNRPWRSVPN